MQGSKRTFLSGDKFYTFFSTGGRSKNKWHSTFPIYSSKMDYSVTEDKGS